MAAIPAVHWNCMFGSRFAIPDHATAALEQLLAVDATVFHFPEELSPLRSFIEGGVARVEVNRYDRDPQAREACLHHWDYRCSACDLSMDERCGKSGHEFVNVHHLVALSTVGSGYYVDPRVSRVRRVVLDPPDHVYAAGQSGS